jgi:hypothetical protein
MRSKWKRRKEKIKKISEVKIRRRKK